VKSVAFVRLGAIAFVLAACDQGSSPVVPESSQVSLTVVSGNNQSAPVNTQLPQPIRVRVTDTKGHPVGDFTINFVVTAGGGSVFGGAETTNKDGYADERWTLGPRLGPQTVEARTVDPNTGAEHTYGTFTATPTPPANVPVVGGNNTGIFMMNADGSGFEQLTNNSADGGPDLSPDHSRIAFASTLGSATAVYLMSIGTTVRHIISSSAACFANQPRFSPDGNLVVYQGNFPVGSCGPVQDQGVQVVDLSGTVEGTITRQAAELGAPSWRADGQQFFLTTNAITFVNDLYQTINDPRHPGDFSNVGIGAQLTHFLDVFESAASPDGHQIAFIAGPQGSNPTSLYVMDIDGSNPRLLNSAHVAGPLSYSPDGSLIAVDHGFMNADGTGYTPVQGCPCKFAWK
jgi:dipeptidyl aminopeptidase/acylaminoacyl peptidase